jgi:hypothetical protein
MNHGGDASLPPASTSTNSRSCADQPGLSSCENHGARNQVFNRCTGKIRWVQRALGHGLVSGFSNEAGELFVGHRLAIDPEAGNSYFMDRTLLSMELL